MSEIYATRGPLVRMLYLLAALAWTAGRKIVRRPPAPVTLCYHGVRAAERGRFERQMRHLARRAPRTALTFDDAFANLLEHALPVTSKLGLPVTVFAVAGNLGAPPRWAMPPGHADAAERTMSAEELAALAADAGARATIGAHGLTHANLLDLSPAAARREMVRARDILEDVVGGPVRALALPHGAADDALLRSAFDAGYREVHVLDAVAARRDGAGLVVERFRMSPRTWPIEFALTVGGGYAWLPPLRRWLRRHRLGRGPRGMAKTRLAVESR